VTGRAGAAVLVGVVIVALGGVTLDRSYSEFEGEVTIRLLDSFGDLKRVLGTPQRVSAAYDLAAGSRKWLEMVALWERGVEARFDMTGSSDEKHIPADSRAVVLAIQAPFKGTVQFGAADRFRVRLGDRCKEIHDQLLRELLDGFDVRCESDYDVARRIVVTAPSAERRRTIPSAMTQSMLTVPHFPRE
jgi:hypothetical protein